MKSFIVNFNLVMPGATRATDYKIEVMADTRADALMLAEAQWQRDVNEYNVSIKEKKEVQ